MPGTATFEVFLDNAGEWRWRLVAANGNIIADSGEGYRSKQGAKRGIESVKRSSPDAAIDVLDDG
ncbi:HVO_2922 family protein [Halopenitus sp. H-Gu1]|uniref:HVO_2922 family protein n=1 Tax=Halopenitus sp. H-Gu1 TaxID=3242697 RepID=UPI00359DFEDD